MAASFTASIRRTHEPLNHAPVFGSLPAANRQPIRNVSHETFRIGQFAIAGLW